MQMDLQEEQLGGPVLAQVFAGPWEQWVNLFADRAHALDELAARNLLPAYMDEWLRGLTTPWGPVLVFVDVSHPATELCGFTRATMSQLVQ